MHYADGTADPNVIVSWSGEDVSGTGVAFVAQSAGTSSQVAGRAVGTARIRASFANPGGPTVSATATLNVISVPSNLVLTGSGLALTKGATRQYTATARYNDGSPDVDVTRGATWSSSAPGIATVSNDGVVKATGSQDGAAVTISATYTYTNASGGTSRLSANKIVTITVLPPVSLAIAPTSVPTLSPGDTQRFTATGTYADGSTLDVTNRVNWSSDSGIGSVTSGS